MRSLPTSVGTTSINQGLRHLTQEGSSDFEDKQCGDGKLRIICATHYAISSPRGPCVVGYSERGLMRDSHQTRLPALTWAIHGVDQYASILSVRSTLMCQRGDHHWLRLPSHSTIVLVAHLIPIVIRPSVD